MALSISIPTQYGVAATYWKICTVNADYFQNVVSVELVGWLSDSERLSGKMPLAKRVFSWGDKFDFKEDASINIRTLAYQLIKAPTVDVDGQKVVSEFAGAADV